MEELKLNEKELIELTIKYGYDGSELNNPHFVEKGYLKNNNKYKKFIEKVESICESWEKLRKKKGEKHPYYIIRGLKPVDNVNLVIEDKRSIAQHDKNIEIMAKYLYNQLENGLNGNFFTLNKWMTKIGGFNPDKVDNKLIDTYFDKLYYGADLDSIKMTAKEYFKLRNQRVMGQMINHLKYKNLIEVHKKFGAVLIDDTYKIIEKDTYNKWRKELKELVESYGLKLNNYRYFLNREEYDELKEEIELYTRLTGIKNVFTTYNLYITDKNADFDNVDFKQFQKAYNDKLIKHIIELPECDQKYQNYFNQRYKKFNYLMILKLSNWRIEIDEKLIERFEPNPFAIELMIINRKHHKGMEQVYKRLRDETNEFKKAITDETVDIFDFPEEVLNPLNFLPFIVDNAVRIM